MQDDPDRNRGAVEQDRPGQETNVDFEDQIGHRHKGPLIDSHDTDFPEPGENPEHSGEVATTEQAPKSRSKDKNLTEDVDENDQDPGSLQKKNKNQKKDDPMAA